MILFLSLGKIVGAAKEMAIAYRYGVAESVDAYLFVFNLVTWPIAAWFSVLTVVLVPLAARTREGGEENHDQFQAELLGLSLTLGAGLVLVAWWGIPKLIYLSSFALPSRTALIASEICGALVLLIPIGILVSLFSAWMLAASRHANTLLESVPSFIILAAVLVFSEHAWKPLVWGTVAGFAFQFLLLGLLLHRKGDIHWPKLHLRSDVWPTFWRGFGIILAGQLVMSSITIIDQFFAARLGEGAIATLGYANRILGLVLSLGALTIARATLPVFSRIEAENSDSLYPIAAQWIRIGFGIGLLFALVGWAVSPWIVGALFERGAFTRLDTIAVSDVLRFGLPQLPFYFAGLVLVSYASTQRAYTLLFLSSVIATTLKIAANSQLVPILGVKGIAIGWAIVYAGTAAFFWFTLMCFRRQQLGPR